jgi:hypothetical protein
MVQGKVALRLDQLRGDVQQGLSSGIGEPWDVDAVKRKLHTRRTEKSPTKVRA